MRFLKNHENGKNSTPVQFLGLKIGPDQDYMVLHNRKIQIFDFSIFFKIMAFFRSKMAKISIFWPKKGHNFEKNRNKLELSWTPEN